VESPVAKDFSVRRMVLRLFLIIEIGIILSPILLSAEDSRWSLPSAKAGGGNDRRRTFVFILSADGRRFHSPEIDVIDGKKTFKNVYFPERHFLYLKKTAIQKRGAFNSLIYYDPASDAPHTDTKIVWVTARTYKEISLVETDSTKDPWSVVRQYVVPRSRVSLIYFGHSLIFSSEASVDASFSSPSDESSPEAPFGLPQFVQGLHETGIHYESVSFFSCRMSSLEVLTALLPYTDYVLGNVYPTSHKSWWASYRFLETVQKSDTAEEVLQNILEINRLNSEKNLETGRNLRTSHVWNYFRLAYLNAFNQALREVWQYLYNTYIREKNFHDLSPLLEHSKLSGNWEKRFIEGVDLGKLLLNLSKDASAPPSVRVALDFMTTPGKLLGEPFAGREDSGLWGPLQP